MKFEINKDEATAILKAIILAAKRPDTNDELLEFYVYMKNKFIDLLKDEKKVDENEIEKDDK